MPKNKSLLSLTSQEQAAHILKKTQKVGEETRETVAVELSKQMKISMYGRIANNRLTNPNSKNYRDQIFIHPYGKEGSAVSCTHIYTSLDGREFVLLARQQRDINPNKTFKVDRWTPVGGYANPHFIAGYDPTFNPQSSEEKDAQFELQEGNVDAIKLDQTVEKKSVKKPNYSLQDLQKHVHAYYIKQLLIHPHGQFEIASRPYLAKQGIFPDPQTDLNAKETARRESREETNIFALNPGTTPKYQDVYTNNDPGISSGTSLQTKVTNALFDWGVCSSAPLVKPGHDIAELKWVPTDEMTLPDNEDIDPTQHLTACACYKGSPINLDYGRTVIPRLLATYRDNLINKLTMFNGMSRYTTRENFATMLDVEFDIKLEIDSQQLGAKAQHQQQLVVTLATFIGEKRLRDINTADLQQIIDKHPKLNLNSNPLGLTT